MRAACAAALVLAAVAPVAASEFALWPLFAWARDRTSGTLQWSALGPLVAYRATPTDADLVIRPLLRVRRHDGATHLDLLYPLASVDRQADAWSARLLLLSADHRAAPPPTRTRFSLYPLLFYLDDGGGAVDRMAFPLWIDVHDTFGWTRVRSVAFPLYLELDEPGVQRRWMPFPFLSLVTGDGAHGFGLFPFAGTASVAGREASGFVLWPFVTWEDRTLPGGGVERRRVIFPVRATLESPDRAVEGAGVVARLRSIDRRRGTEMLGTPWPLVVRERRLGEEAWTTWRAFPFYGRSASDGIERRFAAWPAWRTVDEDRDGFHFRGRDAMLVLWRDERDWDEASGREHGLSIALGLWRAERTDTYRVGQAPALLDAVAPRARGLQALWSPLWALFRWEGVGHDTDWSLLYGLVGRRHGRLHGPWYLHPDDG